MEAAFVSMICIALIVVGGMTMARGFLSTIDTTSMNIDTMSQRSEDKMRTNLSVIEVDQISSYRFEILLENVGQTKLSDFEKWDIIVHHRGDDLVQYVTWLPYVNGTPSDDEWSVEGIYTATDLDEVFEPDIFNPDEHMIIEMRLDPGVDPESTNLVSITTPNGVTVSKSFVGEY